VCLYICKVMCCDSVGVGGVYKKPLYGMGGGFYNKLTMWCMCVSILCIYGVYEFTVYAEDVE